MVFDQIKDKKFDLIFIDGCHEYDWVVKDCQTAIKINIPWILVDDFDSSEDIRRACAEIPEFELVKIYENVHNIANIGLALFRNKNV